ncbi:MAG: BatD family protein [Candidatus Poribacteria bacterium]|nr:BatD family protein [Candidatus Poribacteria bacterium]
MLSYRLLSYLRFTLLDFSDLMFGLIIIACCLSISSAAESIQVQSNLSPKTITLEQSAILKITLFGETQLSKISPPELPAVDSDMWQTLSISYIGLSNQYQFSNGKIPVIMTWSYSLKPKKIGITTIPPFEIEYNNEILSTLPHNLQITSSSFNENGENSYENPFYGGRQRIEATVDRANPYLNQQVTYTFRYFYTARLPTPDSPNYISPSFSHFREKRLGSDDNQTKAINGQQFRMEEIKVALFPLKTGRVVIEPAKLRFPISPSLTDNSPPPELITNSVGLNIQSLPTKGKPVNFGNIVGQYQIRASLDKKSVQLNEAVILTVKVFGYGNFETHPNLQLPLMTQFITHIPEIQDKSEIHQGKIYGKRMYKYVLVPVQIGVTSVPPIPYSYFDPIAEQYNEISTGALSLAVLPKSINVRSLSASADIIANTEMKKKMNLIYTAFAFFFILLISCGVYFSVKWLQDYKNNKRKKQINTDPLQKAIQSIKRAETFGELSTIVYNYVGEIHDKSARGWNPEMVRQHLVNRSIPVKLVSALISILRQCDLEQFSITDKQATIEHIRIQTQQFLTQIDRLK